MNIEVLVVSPFQQNCRILSCEKTGEAIVIDPGDEASRILAKIEELAVTPKYILATHGHIDHVGAVAEVQQQLKIPFYIHKNDIPMIENLPFQALSFGLTGYKSPTVDRLIEAGDTFCFGSYKAETIFTPGHSPGSVSFLFGKDLFSGDVLFAGGVGRTDLPGADPEVLKRTLREEILTLPDDINVYSGHGPDTTIGREKTWLREWV